MNKHQAATLNVAIIAQVINKIIQKSSNQIRIGLHISENIDFQKLPHYKNKSTFELQYSNLNEVMLDNNAKVVFNSWLVNRGFEELMKAINEGLNVTNLIIELAREKKIVYDKSEKISSMSIPALIAKIEKSTGKALELKDIIMSINKARNVLIHFNGKVVKKHCNNRQPDRLVLMWRKFFVFAIENGNEVEVKMGGKYTGAIRLKTIDCSKSFKIGEKVEISVNEYEELLSTVGAILAAELTEITKGYIQSLNV